MTNENFNKFCMDESDQMLLLISRTNKNVKGYNKNSK